MHIDRFALCGKNFIRNVRHSGYYIHIEFPVESLLNYFHVEQTKESTTESEIQGRLMIPGSNENAASLR